MDKTVPAYYFAYGSNLNKAQMRLRCPGSTAIGLFSLEGYQLVFRRVADVAPAEGQTAFGALYTITKSDELTLDRYEGFRQSAPDRGKYRKVVLELTVAGLPASVMFYVMNSTSISPPDPHYYSVIHEGYLDWQIDVASLEEARRRSESF